MWDCIGSAGFWSGEIWHRRKNGEVLAQLLSISRVADNNGSVRHYICLFSDISHIKVLPPVFVLQGVPEIIDTQIAARARNAPWTIKQCNPISLLWHALS
jgi:hypothetical protein